MPVPSLARSPATLVPALLLLAAPLRAQAPPPILDMHLHAYPADAQGPPPVAICAPFERFPPWDPAEPYGRLLLRTLKDPPCPDPIWGPETDEGVLRGTLEVMERRNLYGVLSGTPARVAAWRAAAPGRFVPGLGFNVVADREITPDSLRALVASGAVEVLAEVTNPYAGVAPDDPRMEPYWALAEELDIPVGIHVGPGAPGILYAAAPAYRARLSSALTLEETLARHPRLRVWVMHAGYPLVDDLLALLYAHPQVHVDIGVIAYTRPRADFHRFLERIVEAGLVDRVMFGSDQMVWPGAIDRAIAAVEEAPFLSEAQKRAILYDNGARFLRLDEATRARHRRGGDARD